YTATQIVEKINKDLHKLDENKEIVNGWQMGWMEMDGENWSGASVDIFPYHLRALTDPHANFLPAFDKSLPTNIFEQWMSNYMMPIAMVPTSIIITQKFLIWTYDTIVEIQVSAIISFYLISTSTITSGDFILNISHVFNIIVTNSNKLCDTYVLSHLNHFGYFDFLVFCEHSTDRDAGEYDETLRELCKPTFEKQLPEDSIVPLHLTLHQLIIKMFEENLLLCAMEDMDLADMQQHSILLYKSTIEASW
ncbi:hypothetical protein EV363DRAFT_1165913, partial [Boletus edulis]